MSSFFTASVEGSIDADLTGLAWRISLYLDELLELLGPEPVVSEDPLVALAASAASPSDSPTDPVLARLLPEGLVEEGEGAAEFRQFTHDSLLARKRADAQALRGLLDSGNLLLSQSSARHVLGSLNDLRLMLGTKLMVAEDGEFQGDDLSELAAYTTYQLLGWLQEELLDALT